jgi:hypothetical protein
MWLIRQCLFFRQLIVFGVDGPVGPDLAEAATTEAKRHLSDYFSGFHFFFSILIFKSEKSQLK